MSFLRPGFLTLLKFLKKIFLLYFSLDLGVPPEPLYFLRTCDSDNLTLFGKIKSNDTTNDIDDFI